MQIKSLTAKQVLNSKAAPTVEVSAETGDGVFISQAPSGTSSGKYEASVVGVEKAIYNVREIIAPKICNKEFASQKEFDEVLIKMAGKNKVKLGANAVLPVSVSTCRAFAAAEKIPLYTFISEVYRSLTSREPEVRLRYNLPIPCVLLIEGGKHRNPSAGSGQANLDIQEFMIVPQANSFSKNYEIAAVVYNELEQILKQNFGEERTALGMEGGFTPPIETAEQALDLIVRAIEKTGSKDNLQIGIDSAASEFSKDNKYNLEFYTKLTEKYPISFIEDPFSEDDFKNWETTKQLQGRGVLIVGDDLTTTNPERMQKAHTKSFCNAVIIKPNQIGTVTETIQAAKLAKDFGWKTIVSHRSGDTTDNFIADLSVGIGSQYIKSGGPTLPERKAKYDRLLEIEKRICYNN